MLKNKMLSAMGGAPANYIEDVFSTYLYTGNGSTQTITNGIDLAGEGGLVWLKSRSQVASHGLFDTLRGANNQLLSDSTASAQAVSSRLDAFTSSGFTLGSYGSLNGSGSTYASWTFRKQPKFFDVVTYTGNGTTQNIAHNLGSTPGCIIVKNTTSATVWSVWHRSVNGGAAYGVLNLTDAFYTDAGGAAIIWGNNSSYVAPTATQFTVGSNSRVNTAGNTYVAYLFAHDAGGFGESGADNVISCGSWTGNGGAVSVNLGYEPQWILYRRSDSTSYWHMLDNMRGVPTGGNDSLLWANVADAESTSFDQLDFNATGFTIKNTGALSVNGANYIYIAIRRGPMKTPTTGTSVFAPIASSAASGTAITTGFPVDAQFGKYRSGAASWSVVDRLRGVSTASTEVGLSLATNSTAAEGTASGADSNNWGSTGFSMPSNLGGISDIFYNFRRAPGFFDVVCYTGAGGNQTFNHNLGVAPELMIVKCRSTAGEMWSVYSSYNGLGFLYLNSVGAYNSANVFWNNTAPTSTTFTVSGDGGVGLSGRTYVAYLFASCPGVSKVGSYTGTGTTQQINCGFTGGARFVLIKRTDSTGDWYVWDSARGIVAGNDPYLLLNSTAAEVTSTDYIDPVSSGFEISSTAPAAINASGGSFIFLAIA